MLLTPDVPTSYILHPALLFTPCQHAGLPLTGRGSKWFQLKRHMFGVQLTAGGLARHMLSVPFNMQVCPHPCCEQCTGCDMQAPQQGTCCTLPCSSSTVDMQVCPHLFCKQCTRPSWVCPAGDLPVCAQQLWQQALATRQLGPGHRSHQQVRALQSAQCTVPLKTRRHGGRKVAL